MSGEIKGRMAKGAAWMVALRLSVTTLGFASTVVLARLLVPADFGLLALGTSMLAALELLTSFRFDIALIQNQTAVRADYDSAWTLNQMFGATLALLLALAAFPAAEFYDEPRLAPVILVLSGAAFLDGFQNIGIVNFRKDLNFAREFAFTVTRKVVQVLVAAFMAFWLRTYWALAAGIVASSVTGVVASYLMHPYRPRWALSRTRQLVGFSKWLLLDNLTYFLRHRSSDVIIGKLAGPAQLGLFGLAYELAQIAHNNLTAPIDRAMFPGYARMARDGPTLREGYLSVAGMTSLIAVPVAVGTASVAPLLVPLLFGPQWQDAVPVLQVLGFASAMSLLGAGAGVVYLALGKPRILLFISGNYIVFLLTSMALLLPRMGLVGAGWAFLIAASVTLPVQLSILNWALGMAPILWLRRVWRPVAAATAMHLAVTALMIALPAAGTGIESALQAAVVIGGGALCYVVVVLVLWWLAGRPAGPERLLIERLARMRGAGADAAAAR
jgi:O-antigen/teichoic acid export membrane protein